MSETAQLFVIGANGQFGSAVVLAAQAHDLRPVRLAHEECEVTDPASVGRALRTAGPADTVVNTAAFHKTDECEDAPQRALTVNALGAYHVASAARARGARVVYVSSDYVFEGTKRQPYVESDSPNPVNVYGVSKAAGEMFVRLANPQHYIVRLSSVFGLAGSSGKGGNFVETMIAKARAGTQPVVVEDIIMAPTSAADAAALLLQLIARAAPPGIYHLANAGSCSWFEFAREILSQAGLNVPVAATNSEEQRSRARRPRYSVLASERLRDVGLAARSWQDGLRDYLRAKAYVAST